MSYRAYRTAWAVADFCSQQCGRQISVARDPSALALGLRSWVLRTPRGRVIGLLDEEEMEALTEDEFVTVTDAVLADLRPNADPFARRLRRLSLLQRAQANALYQDARAHIEQGLLPNLPSWTPWVVESELVSLAIRTGQVVLLPTERWYADGNSSWRRQIDKWLGLQARAMEGSP